jgi:S-adenosylmethionine:tRNA ribosyltransferase-isomerase
MKTSDFDYALAPELIAQSPLEPRDASRLLVVERATGRLEHRTFRDIGDYLEAGDLLVANESRVIPARLYGRKVPTGGRVEILLLRRLDGRNWVALVGGRRVRVGSRIELVRGSPAQAGRGEPAGIQAEVTACHEAGQRTLYFSEPVETWLGQLGLTPLPPYIHTHLSNPERYQTIYARTPGSAAAPTAGLHFTPELVAALQQKGVQWGLVTLHIGLDTFRPVEEDTLEDHVIHTEWCCLSQELAGQIQRTRAAGRRVIAVGTTSVRVLETAGRHRANNKYQISKVVSPFEGPTDLFIYPGFEFRVVDALITNFHLPRSTLLALVSAFAGPELIMGAYQEATRQRYRFYSFGDAMLII